MNNLRIANSIGTRPATVSKWRVRFEREGNEGLRERKAFYVVGTPKSELRHFEAELLEQDNWTAVQEGLEARLIEHPDGNGKEKYVLYRSSQRAEKERAMLASQMDRLTLELMKIDYRLRKLKNKPCG